MAASREEDIMAAQPFDQRDGVIWMDGEYVKWADAKVHILTHTLHDGLGVFEGIRCYRTDDGRSAGAVRIGGQRPCRGRVPARDRERGDRRGSHHPCHHGVLHGLRRAGR